MMTSSADEARFQALVKKMVACVDDGNVPRAIQHATAALAIRHSDKLVRRLSKMKAYLAELEEENTAQMENLGQGLYVQKRTAQKIYGYQREGLTWLWKLHRNVQGGVLGDDMGLGKTVQIIVFLASMFDMDKIKTALIIMPVSLIANWMNEFDKWASDMKVYDYHGSTKRQRELIMERVQRKGGVVFATYGILAGTGTDLLSRSVVRSGKPFFWDYMILDEGHKIKNPTKCTKGAHAIPSVHRIVLTGTPVQNNLVELWSLYDFTHKGRLLGTLRTFRLEVEGPIKRSRERDATVGEKALGNEMAIALRQKIAPFFLRRTKAEVMSSADMGNSSVLRPVALNRKNDFVVWTFLSDTQVRIYNDFLKQDVVKEVLMAKRSPLVEINIMKKICDHPRLLKAEACRTLGLDDSPKYFGGTGVSFDHVSDEDLMEESGKMKFLMKLLENLKDEGHRCLVFSQSRLILDIAQRLLRGLGIRFLRIDGLVKSSHDRQALIETFDNNLKYTVLLLTSQVGGVGLTITSADRVVVFDPSWNPATDSQSIDRCYRIGQTKPVVVYRLITCGTVEEKIYRRQVFKQSLHKQTTEGDRDPFRYFRNQELYELFHLDDTRQSTTQVQLERMHAGDRKTDVGLDAHIAQLYSLDIFGISDHDLLFTVASNDDDEHSHEEQKYIDAKVKRAQELVSLECQMREMDVQDNVHVEPRTTLSRSYKSESRKQQPLLTKAYFMNGNNEERSTESESGRGSDTDDYDNSSDVSTSPSKLVALDGSVVVEDTADVAPMISPKRSTSDVILVSDTEGEEDEDGADADADATYNSLEDSNFVEDSMRHFKKSTLPGSEIANRMDDPTTSSEPLYAFMSPTMPSHSSVTTFGRRDSNMMSLQTKTTTSLDAGDVTGQASAKLESSLPSISVANESNGGDEDGRGDNQTMNTDHEDSFNEGNDELHSLGAGREAAEEEEAAAAAAARASKNRRSSMLVNLQSNLVDSDEDTTDDEDYSADDGTNSDESDSSELESSQVSESQSEWTLDSSLSSKASPVKAKKRLAQRISESESESESEAESESESD